jgi:hypothetical protein
MAEKESEAYDFSKTEAELYKTAYICALLTPKK